MSKDTKISKSTKIVVAILTLVIGFFITYLPTIKTHGLTGFLSFLEDPDPVGLAVSLILTCLVALETFLYENTQVQLEELNLNLEKLRREIDVKARGLQVLNPYFKAKNGKYSELFGRLADFGLQRLQKDLEGMLGDKPEYSLRLNDPALEYIEIFVQIMMGLMDEGSSFDVITNEVVWSKDNFGHGRRYLLANAAAVKERGITIRRVFFIPPAKYLEQNSEQARQLLDKLNEHNDVLGNYKTVQLSVYQTRNEEEFFEHFEGIGNNFALWKVSGEEICTFVEYKQSPSNHPRISGITFRADTDFIKEKHGIFSKIHERTIPLNEYLEKLTTLLGEENDAANGRANAYHYEH